MVIVLGADVHKATHTFVAVDEVGRKLGETHGEGHHGGARGCVAVGASASSATELRWGVEDCRHLSARLERDLLAGGQQVVRVPPKLMAQIAGVGAGAGQVRPDRRARRRAGGAPRTRPARQPSTTSRHAS